MKAKVIPNRPYELSEHIIVYPEWHVGNETLVPGTLFKIKDDRRIYKFRQYVNNTALDVQWIDCWATDTGEFKSVVASRFKTVYKGKYVKKSRSSTK